jgi:hypothetical protein
MTQLYDVSYTGDLNLTEPNNPMCLLINKFTATT